jgi:exoribonuclease II
MGLARIKDETDTEAEKTLQKGVLLEFEKENSKKLVLAVAHRPDGKNNWIVYDQVSA